MSRQSALRTVSESPEPKFFAVRIGSRYLNKLADGLYGPPYREGLAKGVARGSVKGQVKLLARMLEVRFGPVSPEIGERLSSMNSAELTKLGARFLDCKRVEDFLSLLGPARAPRKRKAVKVPGMLSEREILKNAIFGPPYREGLAKGEALADARCQVDLIMAQMDVRFGTVPPTVRRRLVAMKEERRIETGLQLLQARSIEQILHS